MSEKKIIKLISIWGKKPKEYNLGRDEVMIQAVVDVDGFWQTRHLHVGKNDPILKS